MITRITTYVLNGLNEVDAFKVQNRNTVTLNSNIFNFVSCSHRIIMSFIKLLNVSTSIIYNFFDFEREKVCALIGVPKLIINFILKHET